MTTNPNERDTKTDPLDPQALLGMSGTFFDGVANILGKFSELAEKGEQLRRSGAATSSDGKSGVSYGFSMRFGPGTNKDVDVAPLQTKRTVRATRGAKPLDAVREPQVDLFEEADHILVVAEMPGVEAKDVNLEFDDKELFMHGKGKHFSFQKKLDLPYPCQPEQVSVTANNGVIEIKLLRTVESINS